MVSRYDLMEGGVAHLLLATEVANMEVFVSMASKQELGLVKPGIVLDPFHLVIASNRAHMEILRGTSRTGYARERYSNQNF